MLEVDEGGGDDECDENPIRNRDLPWVISPNNEEQERRHQLDREITKRDWRPASGAATAQHNPTQQRQIMTPRNRLFARRAKRPLRLVHGKIKRQPVDDDVKKGADGRP